jgi:gamma-glutamylputrescine oxidase
MSLDSTDSELTRNSYYEATAPRTERHAAAAGEIHCDVAVVGAGLAGLSAALELARRGQDVRVLEARHVGFGASGRNGGQAIHGFACDPAEIEAQLGAAAARQAWDMSMAALQLIRQRIREYSIECHWQDGYLSLATGQRKARSLMQWADSMQRRYGLALQRIEPAELPKWIASPRFHSGVHDPQSGHLHPLRYTQGIARAAEEAGALIHEDSPVTRLQGGAQVVLHTPQARVVARQVLLAGNVYLPAALAPALHTRIMPVGTYIACTEALPSALASSLIPSRAAICDTNFVLDYFRTTHDQRMLYGGRVSYSTATPMNLSHSMRRRMLLSFPQLRDARIEYAWGGFVDITMNRAPDFGRLPPARGGAANVYYLQGFSGHGLALTGLAGLLVAEAMHGDASRFDVFARLKHRAFPGGARLRMPALVLGMAWYRLRDLLA